MKTTRLNQSCYLTLLYYFLTQYKKGDTISSLAPKKSFTQSKMVIERQVQVGLLYQDIKS